MQIASAGGFYEIPQELIEELDLYRLEVERLQQGEISEEAFKAFRVPRGVYSQRGGQTHMIRIKVPGGGITPVQMEAIADLSARYGDGTPHVTDRQDVQIHGVRLEDTAAVLEALARVSLTARGGGGNTIRNITACAEAGVCSQEVFDVTPYAVALAERYMTDPRSGVLPRKFKVAFSGCPRNCALATVNDLGFIAKSREVNGRVARGFAVYAAGGMGAYSRVADRIEDFIPETEVLNVAEAILRIFDRLGDRDNRNRARLRFVADRLGQEGFRRVYEEELHRVRSERLTPLFLREPPEGRRHPLKDTEPAGGVGGSSDPEFQKWVRTAVRPQRQAGYHYAEIRLSLGNLTAVQLKGLAGVASRFGEGTVRTTHRQNIVLRWLQQDELHPLYRALEEIGLHASGARGVSDVLSCPGAATCNLGICLSRGLSSEIARVLEGDDLPLEELRDVDIRVSGCPNACGQHPIGAIGVHGVARRTDGRAAPHYRVFLGGRTEEGETALGTLAGAVPAKRVPELIRAILRRYLSEREGDETLHAFLGRSGLQGMEELVGAWAEMPPYDERPEFYVDWGADEPFSLAGLRPGECGAGVRDLIASDIGDAGRYLYRARRGLQEGAQGGPAADLYRALSLAARALLVTRGVQPETDAEVFGLFREQFVESGLVSSRYLGIAETAMRLSLGDIALGTPDYVGDLIDRVQALYNSMDASLQFHAPAEEPAVASVEAPATEAMDLRGVQCPFNYVQAKLQLETMSAGQILRLLLDDGEPIQNVPHSLENDGQEVCDVRREDGYYEVIIKKCA